jgi:4-aminobutyrate aminotransferase
VPDLYARDRAALSTLSNLRFFPQAVIAGSGSWLLADDGRKLLDLSASWGAVSLGHAHPAVVNAVTRAIGDQAGASHLSGTNLAVVDLAERLLAIVPERARGRVWLGHSGSDANETVARVVTAATGRPRIIAFRGAYHGGTVGSMAVSGHPAQTGAKAAGLSLIPYPDAYRDGGADAAAQAALAELDQLLTRTIDPGEVAALMFEPIQSDGGMLVPPDGFFPAVETICRRHGILLVCDEVKVGLGRSGRLHAFEHLGIEPDVVVFGKGLGGGLPISAVVGPEWLMNHATGFALQTLHGNPVCAAAACAVLDTIAAEGLSGNAAEVGTGLVTALRDLAGRQPLIGDVRGRGLAIGVELVDGPRGDAARMLTAKVVYRAYELGLVLYYVGVGSNVLELTPPLTLTPAEAQQGVAILEQALADVAAGQVPDEAVAAFAGW